jgi:hypothetical protein
MEERMIRGKKSKENEGKEENKEIEMDEIR